MFSCVNLVFQLNCIKVFALSALQAIDSTFNKYIQYKKYKHLIKSILEKKKNLCIYNYNKH